MYTNILSAIVIILILGAIYSIRTHSCSVNCKCSCDGDKCNRDSVDVATSKQQGYYHGISNICGIPMVTISNSESEPHHKVYVELDVVTDIFAAYGVSQEGYEKLMAKNNQPVSGEPVSSAVTYVDTTKTKKRNMQATPKKAKKK